MLDTLHVFQLKAWTRRSAQIIDEDQSEDLLSDGANALMFLLADSPAF